MSFPGMNGERPFGDSNQLYHLTLAKRIVSGTFQRERENPSLLKGVIVLK